MNWLPIEKCPKDGKRYLLASRVYWKDIPFLWNFYVGYYKEYKRPKDGESGRWLDCESDRKINPEYYCPIIKPTEIRK